MDIKELYKKARKLIPEEDWETAIAAHKERIEGYIKDTDIKPDEAYRDIRAIITNECRMKILLTAAAAYEIKKES